MEKIGKYEILKELGKGGMGSVYMAKDPMIDRTVAIKVLKTELRDDKELKERLFREAKWAGRLSHPNITTIYDLGEIDNSPYIVMEYLSGGDMKTLIERGVPLTLLEKLNMAIEVGEGLAYAHQQDIIHRDIKPENIRILDDRKVKIMDFGIAKPKTGTATQTGMVMGTPSYMSPEQISGKKVGPTTDIFSFGVMFFELLAYKKPFSGDTTARLVYEITQEPPRKLRLHNIDEEITKKLQGIISRCLQKTPAERYPSCIALLKDLKEIRSTWVSEQSTEILTARPCDQETILAKGRELMNENQFEKAREVFSQALQKDPEDEATLIYMETLNRRENEGRYIVDLLEQAEDDQRDHNYEQAIDGYRKVLELDPENKEALTHLQDLEAELTHLTSRVNTTRIKRKKRIPLILAAVAVVAMLGVAAFVALQKEPAEPSEALSPASQSGSASNDSAEIPAPKPQADAPPVDEDRQKAEAQAELLADLKAEVEQLADQTRATREQAGKLPGGLQASAYKRGTQVMDQAQGLVDSDDPQQLRRARDLYNQAQVFFRTVVDQLETDRRRLSQEADRLAAEARSARRAVNGSEEEKNQQRAYRQALALQKEAEAHRKAGRFSQAQQAFRNAAEQFRAAEKAIQQQRRNNLDRIWKEVVSKKSGVPAVHQNLSEFSRALKLEQQGDQARASGQWAKAEEAYRQARLLFEQLAARPLPSEPKPESEPEPEQPPQVIQDQPAETEPKPQPVQQPNPERVERDLLQAFLETYYRYFEAEDIDNLADHINLSRKEKGNWSAFFDFADNIVLTVEDQKIDLKENSADIRLALQLSYLNGATKKQESRSLPIEWHLEKRNGRWQVVHSK